MDVMQIAVSVALAVAAWIGKRHFDMSARLKGVEGLVLERDNQTPPLLRGYARETAVQELVVRLATTDELLKHGLPMIREDVRALMNGQRDLAVSLQGLHGDIKALTERSSAVLRTVDRHERFLEAERKPPSGGGPA